MSKLDEKNGWIGFGAGLMVGAIVFTILCNIGASKAHGVKNRCKTEEYIKVLERYDVEEGHVHYVCVHAEDYVSEFIENSYQNAAVHATVAGSVCEHRRWWEHKHGIRIMAEACDG